MQVDLPHRTATLSVGELAEFSVGPGRRLQRRQGQWRTQVGIQWHQEQETASKKAGEKGRYEVAIRATWPYRGWKFKIQGRIDQWIDEEEQVLIREIKTTSFALPAETDELVEQFNSYFAQLGTYLALLKERRDSTQIYTGELLFINIDDGIRQHVSDDSHCIKLFDTQIGILWNYLEQRRNRSERFKDLPPVRAFQQLREGQESIQADLLSATSESPILFFQAPTGFGKTGVALEYGLNQIIEGRIRQIVYLTSKSSGQHQVMKQLGFMLPEGTALTALQVRNKEEMCRSPACPCQEEDSRLIAGDRWKNCGLSPFYFLEQTEGQPDLFRTIGEKDRLCPYELMRATLPFADVWVGDLNYLFSPRNRSLFVEQPGFNLGETLLILDEAHNLASRVADVFSYRLYHDAIEQWHAELQFSNGHPTIRRALEAWLDFLEGLTSTDQLDDYKVYEARDCAEQLAGALQQYPLQTSLLTEDSVHAIWELADTESFFKNDLIEKLVWSPGQGALHLSCLDASHEIGSVLGQCGQAIIMSATLEPKPYFLKQTGLLGSKTRPSWITANTPWRKDAYDCAIDMRVDTRYRLRNRHYLTTAETLAHCHQWSSGPVACFFPSYRYAESIKQLLDNEFPHLSVALQERGTDPDAQTRFIDESLTEANLLFLIMGSVFAEGIDHLGSHIDRAVIIGPALPEVNALQNKRMEDRKALGRETAFEEVYQIPGMQKINQALGRLVRAPGQSARILFHCKRFAESSYQDLLLEDFRSNLQIHRSEELDQWLQQS